MTTTPARITPQTGAGAAGPSEREGSADTERPPAVVGEAPSSDPAGPASPRGLKAAPISRPGADLPTSAVAPKLAAAPRLPTPSMPTVGGRGGGPAPRTVPMPFDPVKRTQAGGSIVDAPPPTVASGAARAPLPPPVPPPPAAAGTSVGLAPPPAPKRAPSVHGLEGPRTRRCTSCEELYPADFLVCPRDATPLVAVEADADPLLGALVGETYQIVRVIGEGGMGRVYEARHLRLKERRFAVKALHADLARNAEMAARFLREAESASSIKHENVVDVFDVHHLSDGTPYLVGEFLEGEELADYVMRRGPLEARIAAKVTRQVCNALSAAHERGIVHRDMKPENIYVLASSIGPVERGESRTLRVKVLDFGISKAGPNDNSHLTKTGVIMGTPSYMAPEQARGRPVDQRADVYSLGACLYFMVTGRRPFDSDDPTSTLSMVLTEDPVRPREIDDTIPEALELVIQRAMAKDAADRYPSMVELEKALAALGGKSSAIAMSSDSLIPVIPTPAAIQVTGAARAFDVAKAMLGTGSFPPPAQQSGSLARAARPTIVVTSAALGMWLIGGTVAALAGLVRVLHDGEITFTESLLLLVGCLFAGLTPIWLYVMHLKKVVWPNSVRAVELSVDLKRMATSALVTYGGISILGRIVHTVFWRSSRGLASGIWDIVLFLLSLAAALTLGGVAPLLRNLRRRRRD
jgi:serine/threonine protein kinase